MSRILCIIDGMTDPQFEVKEYPNLSTMKSVGLVDTACGRAPESLSCILRLLGVKEVPDNLRGYAEALGAGIPVNKDDLILRGSWVALDKYGCCTVPVQGQEKLEPTAVNYHYYPLGEYKSLLVFPGMAHCVNEIVTYPPYNCAGRPAVQMCPEGNQTLQEAFMEQVSAEHCLIPWGKSVPASVPCFPEKAAVVCGATVVKGIARLLHMNLLDIPDATGDTDTDLEAKTDAALRAAEQYPFVLLHINGADEAAHRRDPKQKKAFLQKVDGTVLSALLDSPYEITVVSDHGTDPVNGLHVGAKQPVFQRREEC